MFFPSIKKKKKKQAPHECVHDFFFDSLMTYFASKHNPSIKQNPCNCVTLFDRGLFTVLFMTSNKSKPN